MKRLKHLLLLVLAVFCLVQCKKEKEVENVADALDYIGATVNKEVTDTALVYHFTKKCADQTESRKKLRQLIAALDLISETEKPKEIWESISTYHYKWDEFALYFKCKNDLLSGYVTEFLNKPE